MEGFLPCYLELYTLHLFDARYRTRRREMGIQRVLCHTPFRTVTEVVWPRLDNCVRVKKHTKGAAEDLPSRRPRVLRVPIVGDERVGSQVRSERKHVILPRPTKARFPRPDRLGHLFCRKADCSLVSHFSGTAVEKPRSHSLSEFHGAV